jgi:hypothetical protein
VPRKELIGVLQVLLQGRRLRIAPELPYAETLCQELLNFKEKPVTVKEDEVAWRERPHDDLVLAAAQAAWQGERAVPWGSFLS